MSSAAPDTGEPLSVAASFNPAGQLTSESRSRPDGVTSVAYSYDRAGQRTQQASTGPDDTSIISYGYTAAGRLASTSQDASTTAFGYDGLGRGLTSTTSTQYGTETSTAVWSGTTVVQQTSDISGTATVLRDALGQIALQSATAGDTSAGPAWSLQDRLGSTVAQTTTTGRVTDLVSYSDFGIPTFASTGFASTTGFTGELSDATTGLNTYFARTYDPMTATWLTADTYRGTLTNPASQHRYGYVEGNPTTYIDRLGFRLDDPGSYARQMSAAEAQGARLTAYGKAYRAAVLGGAATVGESCEGRACGSGKVSKRHLEDVGGYSGWASRFNPECESWDPCPVTKAAPPRVYPADWYPCGTWVNSLMWETLECIPNTPEQNGSEFTGIAIDIGAGILIKRAGTTGSTSYMAGGDLAAQKLLASGAEMSGKSALTRAGYSLTKHGTGARGESLFPAASGTPAQINQQAGTILEAIVANPHSKITPITSGNFVGGYKLTAPTNQMAVFDKDGVFQYFGNGSY